MATIERKSSIRKAPTADVVESLTQRSANLPAMGSTNEPAVPGPNQPTAIAARDAVARPGPGRPRSKRRMEPFSSKIEINLRDDLDDYLAENGMTVVEFLDQAIRDRLQKNNSV